MFNRISDRRQAHLDSACLHSESIKTGFLPTLGVRFLTLMYRCIDEGDDTILIVRYKGEKLSGFVSGTVGTSSIYKAMMRHPVELLIAIFPVIFSLSKLKKIVSIFLHMQGKERTRFPKAELLTICVSSEFRRQGIAEDLFARLAEYYSDKNVREFVIIVGKALEANSFYVAQGGKVVGELSVHKGSPSNVYVKSM